MSIVNVNQQMAGFLEILIVGVSGDRNNGYRRILRNKYDVLLSLIFTTCELAFSSRLANDILPVTFLKNELSVQPFYFATFLFGINRAILVVNQ